MSGRRRLRGHERDAANDDGGDLKRGRVSYTSGGCGAYGPSISLFADQAQRRGTVVWGNQRLPHSLAPVPPSYGIGDIGEAYKFG
jgi:hypothetical protein